MQTMQEPPERLDTQFVTAMLNLKEQGGMPWRESDLAYMWTHQMQAPLNPDLSVSEPRTGETLDRLAETMVDLPETFGELFHHPDPPLDLLKIVKDFAKRHGTDDDGLLPKKICTCLYYISIHLAWKHHKNRISELSEDEIGKGVGWVRSQGWLDEKTQELF